MEQTISLWNYNRRSTLNAFPHFNVSLEVKQSKLLDEPQSEAKVRAGKIEQFQVHALINTDREEICFVPDWVPEGRNFSVPRFPEPLQEDSSAQMERALCYTPAPCGRKV